MPESAPSPSSERWERYVWGDLALRLLHPLRLVIIEALHRCDQAMTVGDLAAVTGEGEELVRYHSKALVREGVLEVVGARPRRQKGGEEALLDFPPQSRESPAAPSVAVPA